MKKFIALVISVQKQFPIINRRTFIALAIIICTIFARGEFRDAGIVLSWSSQQLRGIESVGGKTLEEHYYRAMGDVCRAGRVVCEGFALSITAFGIFAAFMVLNTGSARDPSKA